MLALQRTIGNAATARLLTAQHRVLQRQRDLQPGTSVEFTKEGARCWGSIDFLDDRGKSVKYEVEVDGKPGVTEMVNTGRLKPANEGEELKVGTRVKAQPYKHEFDGTITKVIGDTAQFYDINVEWEEGWQVPEPYAEEGVPERDVRAKNRNQFQARAPRKAPNVQIEHFHPASQLIPNAAEYVRPGGPIDITSHALGSGMYGVAEATPQILNAAVTQGPFRRTVVQINDPLIVQNAVHGEELQSLNKRINQIAQGLQDARKYEKGDIDTAVEAEAEDLQDLLQRVFGRAGMEVPERAKVKDALATFFQRYQTPDAKFVDQPATIFLAELCHLGGIYGDKDSGLNSYQKGSVKFIPPVEPSSRKTRTGTAHEFVT